MSRSPPISSECGGGSATVEGTVLEQPPDQSNGGAYNSTLSAGTVTLAMPLEPGESVNLQFLLGVQQTGNFRFFVNIEADFVPPVLSPGRTGGKNKAGRAAKP